MCYAGNLKRLKKRDRQIAHEFCKRVIGLYLLPVNNGTWFSFCFCQNSSTILALTMRDIYFVFHAQSLHNVLLFFGCHNIQVYCYTWFYHFVFFLYSFPTKNVALLFVICIQPIRSSKIDLHSYTPTTMIAYMHTYFMHYKRFLNLGYVFYCCFLLFTTFAF